MNSKLAMERQQIERKLIGVLMAYPDVIGDVIELGLKPNIFSKQHASYIQKMFDLFSEDLSPTPSLVSHSFSTDTEKHEQYLSGLAQHVVSLKEDKKNIAYYLDLLQDQRKKERIIALCKQAEIAVDKGLSGKELEQKLFDAIFQNELEVERKKGVRFKEGLIEYVNALNIEASLPEDQRRLPTPTGYEDVDRYLNGGVKAGTLTYVVARPSNGKTSMLLNWALNAALDFGLPSVIMSFEMEKDELLEIMLSMITEKLYPDEGIESRFFTNPSRLTQKQWMKIARSLQTLKDIPLWIDDCDGLTIHQLEARVMKYLKLGVDSFFIDYWQLIRLPNGRIPADEAEHAETSEALRRMAKKTDRKFIVAAQAKRASEERDVKQPTMRDLRGSGKAEMDAHVIMTLHYPEFYAHNGDCERPSELDVAFVKNRRGSTGKVSLYFKKEFSLLEDLHPQHLSAPIEQEVKTMASAS